MSAQAARACMPCARAADLWARTAVKDARVGAVTGCTRIFDRMCGTGSPAANKGTEVADLKWHHLCITRVKKKVLAARRVHGRVT